MFSLFKVIKAIKKALSKVGLSFAVVNIIKTIFVVMKLRLHERRC